MPKSTEEIYKDLLAQGQGYQQQADSLLDQINNRPAFAYNAETDPMYQTVKNQYVHQGQRAMQDTMGQAAGLTGGYGSSYSQAVGNQAYNEYLTQLNAQIPVLAQQARQAYDAEGDALRDRYNLALNAANNAYNQGRDALADQRYEDELAWNRDWQQKQWDYNTQQQAQNDARSYAQYLLQMGITPSSDQLAAAGITPQEAASIRNYYNQQAYAASAGAGGGRSGGGRSGGSGGGSKGPSGTSKPSSTTESTIDTAADKAEKSGPPKTIPLTVLQHFAKRMANGDYDRAVDEYYKRFGANPEADQGYYWMIYNSSLYRPGTSSGTGGGKNLISRV